MASQWQCGNFESTLIHGNGDEAGEATFFFGSTSLMEAVLGFMCGFLGEAILF